MGVSHFIRQLPERGLTTSWYYFKEWGYQHLPTGNQWGESVFEADWDVLVILDACRADLMAEAATDHDWIDTPATRASIAGSSKEWMERTFTNAYADTIADTAYVTGNPFSQTAFDSHPTKPLCEDVPASDGTELGLIDEVWGYAWDETTGIVGPEAMTDRAIQVGREHDGRLIVHYMQPHVPFLDDPDLHPGFDAEEWGDPDAFRDSDVDVRNLWDRVREGLVDEHRAWEGYRRNLDRVLSEVDRLRHNLDADRCIVTADHGNAIGERGLFGHPDVAIPAIRDVPWVEIDAADERTSVPSLTPPTRLDVAPDVASRLAAAGYREEADTEAEV